MQHQTPSPRVDTGALDTSAFEPGRTAAAVLIAEAYEAALNALHPDDVDERAWYRARLIDARTIADLPPLAPAPGADNDMTPITAREAAALSVAQTSNQEGGG